MEDEKKKKKNKKKKNNKQRARVAVEDTASNAGDTSSSEQNHVLEPKNNHLNRSVVESNGGVIENGSIKIVEGKGDHHNGQGISNSVSADFGKQTWLQEETRLREMIKKLLYEKDLYTQRQADMEMKTKRLQLENDSWHQKEVTLEQRISQLLQEKASLSSEERDLQERFRHSEREKALLVEKENSSKEMVTMLTHENTRLRMQVVELEGAKNNLSQQNRQLIDNISTLQSRIQDLERSLASAHSSVDEQKEVSEKEALNAQIEASCSLVEKLVAENAELVEKVNELYTELGRRNVVPGVTSVVIPNYVNVREPRSAKSFERFEKVPIGDEQMASDDIDSDYAHVAWRPSETTAVSGEIVQIPLHENEAQDMEAQILITREKESVPFIDAPLIGAPFRLISFVASYVSGADLVNKNSSSASETAS